MSEDEYEVISNTQEAGQSHNGNGGMKSCQSTAELAVKGCTTRNIFYFNFKKLLYSIRLF